MKAKDLRNSLLMMAIQGKLVEQDPHDEPAGVFIEEIFREKTELIKQKKIKADKPLPEITDEEKPFDIPDSWEWVRLGDVFSISTGMTPLKNEQKFYNNGNIPWVTSTLTNTEYIFKTEFYITDIALQETSLKIYPAGTLILAMYGQGKTRGQISELAIPCTINQACAALEEIYSNSIFRKYIKFFHRYNYNLIRKISEGSAQPNLNLTKVKETIVPLPPLAEQERIVAKLEELMPMVDEYEKAEMALTSYEDAFPDQLRSSILQAAVQGKLVEQDPSDEPASVLLGKIRAEKEELIKQKKVKAEKPLSEVTDEEKPFDIPDTWEWVRLGEISQVTGGFAFKSTDFNETGIRVVRISDFSESGFIDKNIKKHDYNDSLAPYIIEKNDILLCMTGGTVGKSLFVKEINQKMMTNQRVATIKSILLRPEYIYFNVLSPIIQNIIKSNKNSTNDNIGMDDIRSFSIPLPPLAEQQRIITKVEKLLAMCEKLKEA